jgi:glycosyltransferase involved in cell wall biosynthesis
VRRDARTPVLYLAPWVDYGGTDKGTIDWFRWIDRDRFAPFLATTQPSANRRLAEVFPYAEEVWPLPELMSGSRIPRTVLDLVHTRDIEVVHLMNSRLGYDLLPDLRCVPNPPRVVVQLHVEEAERTGYVRYVTTRYGNLVDAFSVTSEHLAEAVHGYGVPRDKIRVIYTGVDAEQEFAPSRTRPFGGLPADRPHILYPGRLVEQKDPLLMADVAEALRDHGLRFQIHAVGEGQLEPELRARIEERGLQDQIRIHPPTDKLQAWYEACDLLLMTSVFEGVPYVVYEAMAMGIPTVAPALPGNVELLDDTAGGLIEPRDDVRAYVEALTPLLEDPTARMTLGEDTQVRAG